MKTKIKAKNVLEQASIISALTGEYKKLNIEIETTDTCSYITVKDKEIHTLDIHTLLSTKGIHTMIYFKVDGINHWATT